MKHFLACAIILVINPAWAGDTMGSPPVPEGPFVPTIFEVGEPEPLSGFMGPSDWAARGISQEDLIKAVFDGPDLPVVPAVPIPASLLMLIGGLTLFPVCKGMKK